MFAGLKRNKRTFFLVTMANDEYFELREGTSSPEKKEYLLAKLLKQRSEKWLVSLACVRAKRGIMVPGVTSGDRGN